MNSKIGERIKLERKARGLTQADIARDAAVSKAAVSQWELGQSKTMKAENLLSCADSLGVNIRWLITGKGDKGANSDNVVHIESEQHLNDAAVNFAFTAMREHLSSSMREAGSVELESRLFDRLYQLYLLSVDDDEKIDPKANEISRLIRINQ